MSTLYAILLLIATLVMILGIAYKVVQYSKTPAPLKIPTTPAPKTRTGVVIRMAKEVVLFAALFRATKWTWIFGWMFHVSLALAFLRHLRYVIDPDGTFGFLMPLVSLEVVQSFGKYAGIFMLIGLAGLLARRIFVARVRYISAPSDYLMLILIMIIAASGLVTSFVVHTDIIQVKAFMLGMLSFDFQELPQTTTILVHLFFVAVLGLVLPFSKLLHIPGVFFSPTRNQVDNPREQRHIADWAKELDKTRSS